MDHITEIMYKKFDPGPLWCDGKFDGKKEQWWSTGSRVTLIKAREKGNYNTSLEFQDKHANKFSGSQYNLWDRLIENCQWDNVEWPANVAHPWHYTAQILQKESTTEVIANTAVAIANIFKVHHRPIQVTQRSDPWYPPRKKAKLRKKYLISSKESRNSGMMPTLIKEKFKQEKQLIQKSMKYLAIYILSTHVTLCWIITIYHSLACNMPHSHVLSVLCSDGNSIGFKWDYKVARIQPSYQSSQ